jgi:hypothetical protein
MNGSTGRPVHLAPAEDVAVQVRDGFATIRAVVDDEPVAAGFQPDFFRDLGGFQQEMTEQLVVCGGSFSEARDGLLGNDENMRRRLGRDVTEGEDQVVFINDLRRDFAGDDFLEDGFAHGEIILTTKYTNHTKPEAKNHSTSKAQGEPDVSLLKVRRRNSTIWSRN